MGIIKFKPTTPSRRHMIGPDFKEITKDSPEKALCQPLAQSGGRNCYGRITIRHRGGRHKRMYRLIDFKRDLLEVTGKVVSIEYDPNRSSRIALVEYPEQKKRYIIAPVGLKVGDEVITTNEKGAEIKAGNCLLLRNIPQGTLIHNIEMTKGRGGQIVRSAGTSAQIMAKEGPVAHVKMPSGEIRLINLDCRATIGQVSNVDHDAIILGT
ncbi:MAG: 50S ribosomal protein L2, partial [Candidatus Omnitrophota bacterium]